MAGKRTLKKAPPSLHQAHDHAFQSAMSDLRVARDFLHHHLPEVIREKLDFGTLQLHQTTFIDPELRRLMSDMLYSATMKGQEKPAFLYLAVDHQSVADPLMPFRMLKYTCRIIDQYLKEDKCKVLPVVIPLMVYNGQGQYPYSCSLFDLFGEQKALAKQFMLHQFELVDLSQIPDEAIRQHPWSGFLEMLFKHVTARDIMGYLEQVTEIVDHLVAAEANDYLLTMIKYAIEKSEIPDRDAFYDWVHRHFSPPLEDQTMTFAEQLRREGMQQGIQQGMQQGKREGEQTLLIKQFYRRFPSLNPTYEDRIKNGRTEELLLWAERILDAKSIDEVFEA